METFVSSWGDLADAIPIDRRTLYNFRKARAAVIQTRKKDLMRSGRHSVEGWRNILSEFGVRGRGVNSDDPGSDFDLRTLQFRERELKVRRAEFELEKAQRRMLKVAEFEAALGTMLSAFVAALNALPGRAAGKLLPRARVAIMKALQKALDPEMFKRVEVRLPKDFAIDFVDIEETLQSEIDLVKRTLQKCDYLKCEESLD